MAARPTVGLGKPALASSFRQWTHTAVADLGLARSPITVDCADFEAGLSCHHGRPFKDDLQASPVRRS